MNSLFRFFAYLFGGLDTAMEVMPKPPIPLKSRRTLVMAGSEFEDDLEQARR